MDQISYFKKIFKSTKFTNLAWILSHRNIRYNILKHKHYAILKNLLFHGMREVWARSTEGRGRYTIKPAKQTIAWLQGRRTYRKDKTLLHVFFININNQYMYLQICGISIFASKSSTTIFILKQTHSKHTYKERKRILVWLTNTKYSVPYLHHLFQIWNSFILVCPNMHQVTM